MDREVLEVDDDKIWIISYHDETPSIIVLSLLRGQNSMVTFKGGGRGKKKREKKLIFHSNVHSSFQLASITNSTARTRRASLRNCNATGG